MGLSTDVKLALLLILSLFWLCCAGAGVVIAHQRGERTFLWLIIGLLGGPLAWLGAFYTGKTCPHCRSKIHRQATVCPRCLKSQVDGPLSPVEEIHPEALIAQSSRQSRR